MGENGIVSEQDAVTEHYLKEQILTPGEQQQVDSFSEKISLRDPAIVLQYGAACQKKVAAFSDAALKGIHTEDLSGTGEMIEALMTEIDRFSAGEKNSGGLLSRFKKKDSRIERLRAGYDKTEANIDKIVEKLEGHQTQLLKDIILLDRMYETNLIHFKEMTMYILAGKKKLEKERRETIPALKQKAEASGQANDAQALNDYVQICERFEKRLYDLELTRTISIQMAPQIRLLQNNNTLMSEKIQFTVNSTIPLWKNQMAIALGIEHAKEALRAQQAAGDMEAVQNTNRELISMLKEVLGIQEEGRVKRRDAETEFTRIESELKAKTMELSK